MSLEILQDVSTEIQLPQNRRPTVVIGDASTALQAFPAGSIDMAVTSPPYWAQREYGHSNELGQEPTPEQYIQNLTDIFSELRRVLKDRGVFFLNIGDKYSQKRLQMIPERLAIRMQERGWTVRNKVIWQKSNPNPSPVLDRFNNTWEVIYMFVKEPENYLSPKYFFDLDAVREPTKNTSKSRTTDLPYYRDIEDIEAKSILNKNETYNGKFKDQKNVNIGASAGGRMSVNGEYYTRQRKHELTEEVKLEIIRFLRSHRKRVGISPKDIDQKFGTKDTAGHWFRTDRGGYSIPSPSQWNALKEILNIGQTSYDRIMTEEHYVLQTVRKHPKGKNPGDVWRFATASLKEKHFAPFPDKIPERCIQVACPENGIVLDPFVGSGTTLKVAKNLGRRSIGIEIMSNYIPIMNRVIGAEVTTVVL